VAPATTVVVPSTTWVASAPSGVIVRREAPPVNAPSSNAPMVRLFCPTTQAFYPDVTSCAQTWVQVVPGTGTGQGSVPQQPMQQQPYAPQSAPPQSGAPSYLHNVPASPSRGVEVTASTSSSFVTTSSSSSAATSARVVSTSSASMPSSVPVPSRDEAMAAVASARPRVIPAPRADLPRRAVPVMPVSLVAEAQTY